MASEASKLNILGSELVTFSDVLFTLAAKIEANAEDIRYKQSQQLEAELADTINIAAAWAQLIGDYILFKAAEAEFEYNVQSGEPFDVQAGRLNILSAQGQVVLDVIEVQLAERAADFTQQNLVP